MRHAHLQPHRTELAVITHRMNLGIGSRLSLPGLRGSVIDAQMKSTQVKRLLSLVLAVSVFAGTHAATYYVSPSGSDANSGSQTAPWATVTHAVAAAAAGVADLAAAVADADVQEPVGAEVQIAGVVIWEVVGLADQNDF